MRRVKIIRWIPFILVALFFVGACVTTYTRRPVRRLVRVWHRDDGCRVKRVIYPCWSTEGTLKKQIVRCPDGRVWRRKWLHRDNRCRPVEYIP